MKLLQEIIKSDFSWEVPSKSEAGASHKVGYSEVNGWECDCISFRMSGKRRECKHVQLIRDLYLKENAKRSL